MIDEKKIEEAQESIFEDVFLNNGEDIIYTDDENNEDYTEERYDDEQIKEAIGLGARWAIEQFLKGLWHDAKEEPRNSTFLVEYPYHGKLEYSVDCTENMKRVFCDWETYIKHTEITRWLYIDDLMEGGKQ